MRGGIFRLVTVQLVLIAVAALAMYLLRGHEWSAAGAAVFGGGIAVVNALLLARTAVQAAGVATTGSRFGGAGLVAGFVERFVFTLAAFALGIGLWHLDPPSVIAGFALPQFAYAAAARH